MSEIKYSASRLKKFQECPFAYSEIYNKGVPQKSSEPMDFGNVMHSALEHYVRAQIEKLPFDLVAEAKGRLIESSLDALHWYRNLMIICDHAAKRAITDVDNIVGVEEWLSGTIDASIPLTGRVDLLYVYPDRAVVDDYKTGMIVPDQEELEADVQVNMYAYLAAQTFKKKAVTVRFFYPYYGKTITIHFDQAKLIAAADKIGLLVQQIIHCKEWKPKPNRWCKHCQFLLNGCPAVNTRARIGSTPGEFQPDVTLERLFTMIHTAEAELEALKSEAKDRLEHTPAYFENSSILGGWSMRNTYKVDNQDEVIAWLLKNPGIMAAHFNFSADVIWRLRDQPGCPIKIKTENSSEFKIMANTAKNREKFTAWVEYKEKPVERIELPWKHKDGYQVVISNTLNGYRLFTDKAGTLSKIRGSEDYPSIADAKAAFGTIAAGSKTYKAIEAPAADPGKAPEGTPPPPAAAPEDPKNAPEETPTAKEPDGPNPHRQGCAWCGFEPCKCRQETPEDYRINLAKWYIETFGPQQELVEKLKLAAKGTDFSPISWRVVKQVEDALLKKVAICGEDVIKSNRAHNGNGSAAPERDPGTGSNDSESLFDA